MARIYGEIASSALMTFDKSFSRSNGQPLDSTEIFYSLVAAQDYAKTDVAYVGQKIVVIETVEENTTVTHYGIEADGSLKELGAIPVGDGLTVEVVDGKIQLAALEGHESGTYQPFLVDGKIEWREPSATTVEGLDSRLTTVEGDIDALEGVVGNDEAGLVKDVADNAAAITAEVSARETADQANADAIAAVEDKIGEVTEGKTVVEMISDAQTAATYDDTELAGRVTAVEGEVDDLQELTDNIKSSVETLSSNVYTKSEVYTKTEADGAIATAKQEAIDAIMGEAGIDEKYDTLREVADWILSDTTNSAQLITRVTNIENDYLKGADKSELEGEIDALSTFIGDLPEDAASETVVAYIQEVVDDLQIGDYAKLADLNALIERVVALEGKAHEHTNKDVLDGVTAEKVAAWDTAEQNAKDYADGLNTAMDTRVGDVETALEGKVAAEDGKSLVADTLIAKLEGVAEGAQVNVIDSVDEDQFGLDENKKLSLLDIAMGKVTGLQDALDGKADKGTTLASYGITDAYTKTETETRLQEVLDGLSDTSETAASVAQALETYKTSNDQRVSEVESAVATKVEAEEGKSLVADTLISKLEAIEAGAQVNKIEAVKVGDTLLEIVEKAVIIPVGAGLKASTEITVAEDGTLGIGNVNVNKLVQTDGEELILNGGAAK